MEKLIINALKLWNGNQRLTVAFWFVFVPIFLLPMMLAVFKGHGHANLPKNIAIALVIIAVFIYIALKIFSLVAVWRCAPNVTYNVKFKSNLARAVVILNILFYIFMLILLVAMLFDR